MTKPNPLLNKLGDADTDRLVIIPTDDIGVCLASLQAFDVEKEVHAQIELALKAGLDVTHVDSHKGAIMHPKFMQTYIQAAGSRMLPNMLPRLDAVGIEGRGLGDTDRTADTPGLRSIAPDWKSRVANYETFISDALKRFIEGEGIKPIDYRAIRDVMRRPRGIDQK